MSPKINHTSAGNFFKKEGYQNHLIDLKKVFQEKILEQWDIHMSKKKSQFLPCSICKKHKMNLRSKYNS